MNITTTIDAGVSFQRAGTPPPPVYQGIINTGPRTLGEAVQMAVAGIAHESLQPFSPGEPAPFVQSRAVLALLAECYARQVYGSTAAAGLAGRDADFPWPWWAELPGARDLRRFRVENHDPVHLCLVAALRFLVEEKVLAGGLTKIDCPQIAEEARRRIIMAAFADSLELDDTVLDVAR